MTDRQPLEHTDGGNMLAQAEHITPDGHVDEVGCWCGPAVDPVAGLMHTTVATPTAGACQRCGCTDQEACPGGCWWARPGLCSACVDLPTGAQLIAEERLRQVVAEGYTPEHDQDHGPLVLMQAGTAYAWGQHSHFPRDWEWKPKNRLRDLIRAGALYQAAGEIPGIDPLLKLRGDSARDSVAHLIDDLLREARSIDRNGG